MQVSIAIVRIASTGIIPVSTLCTHMRCNCHSVHALPVKVQPEPVLIE